VVARPMLSGAKSDSVV